MRRDAGGQAVVEYIVLLAIVVSMYAFLIREMGKRDFFQKMQQPLTNDFTKT